MRQSHDDIYQGIRYKTKLLNATVMRQSHDIYKGIPFKIKFLNSTVTRQSHDSHATVTHL